MTGFFILLPVIQTFLSLSIRKTIWSFLSVTDKIILIGKYNYSVQFEKRFETESVLATSLTHSEIKLILGDNSAPHFKTHFPHFIFQWK